MSKILELPHLAHQDRVAQVQVRARGVKPSLYPQWSLLFEAFPQIIDLMDLYGAACQFLELNGWVNHVATLARLTRDAVNRGRRRRHLRWRRDDFH